MPCKKFFHFVILSDEQVSLLKNLFVASVKNATLEIHRDDEKAVTTILSGNKNDLEVGCFYLGFLMAKIIDKDTIPTVKG